MLIAAIKVNNTIAPAHRHNQSQLSSSIGREKRVALNEHQLGQIETDKIEAKRGENK